ncbi:uncharacterized protein LOC130820549 [Amaranthus tricolor]|uniref:uncharacterized protein LOC130820549 n=1 Tax=Amaranthus tricolor TaxID=29722 RepID=UPI0025893104|nr:uncharacterized protein LOC130820549 [Amaranthus tricolor]
MKRSPIIYLFLVLVIFISCGASVAQTYFDSLPRWDDAGVGDGPSKSPSAAPHAGVMYIENIVEPPCMQTNGECIDDKCNDDCYKNHGRDGRCMVVPDKNLCCCGI